VKSSTRIPISLSSSTTLYTSTPNDIEEEEATSKKPINLPGISRVLDIGKIVDRENDNIDDVRRARSLARRDRLAQWRATAAKLEDDVRDEQDNYFLLAAFLPAIIAFFGWGNISIMLSKFLAIVGVVNTAPGETFANNLLRPTIIGVVVPTISIALATLVSTTVNVLRQRQVDLRAFINQEVGELRFLRRAVFGMYGTRQHAGRRARALTLLCGYVEQLMSECKDGAVEQIEEMELTGGIAANELDRFSAMLHGVDGAGKSAAFVLFYHVHMCVQCEVLVIWLLHLSFHCIHLLALATHCTNICYVYLSSSS